MHNLMPSLRCPNLTNILTITFTIRKNSSKTRKKLQDFGKIPWNLKSLCCVTLPQIFLDACVRWLVWLQLLEFVEERWTVQVQTYDGVELLEVSSDIAVEVWRQTTLSASVLSPGEYETQKSEQAVKLNSRLTTPLNPTSEFLASGEPHTPHFPLTLDALWGGAMSTESLVRSHVPDKESEGNH